MMKINLQKKKQTNKKQMTISVSLVGESISKTCERKINNSVY